MIESAAIEAFFFT